MTSKDIIYLQSTDPITLLDKPSPESIEIVANFINNPVFNTFITNMRLNFRMPENGLDIKKQVGKPLTKSPQAGVDFIVWSIYLVVDNMRASLGLHESMVDQFVLLICFNAWIDFKYFKGFISYPIQFVLKKREIASKMFDYPNEIGAILIPYATTKHQFIKWIEENWKNEIESKLENTDNLTSNPFLIRLHRSIEISTEIIQLRDRENKSFSEISSILTDKYPNDDRVQSEEWVKETYYFFKDKASLLADSSKMAKVPPLIPSDKN